MIAEFLKELGVALAYGVTTAGVAVVVDKKTANKMEKSLKELDLDNMTEEQFIDAYNKLNSKRKKERLVADALIGTALAIPTGIIMENISTGLDNSSNEESNVTNE